MVEQQIRPWNVLDQRVLDLIATTPREDFVPSAYRSLAFSDTNIPLDCGQVMMTPKVEGRMLQALEVRPEDRALEIGTGSGFVTALLARSCREVTSLEIEPTLSEQAGVKLAALGVGNVKRVVADGVKGWPSAAPYDVIAVTGSVAQLDTCFQEQLARGGRLFVIVGEDPIMQALLVRRIDDGEWVSESLFETSLPPLVGAEPRKRFVL
jgi:protein-L-isoaspartate(D-aspartate) O-methyltransferase